MGSFEKIQGLESSYGLGFYALGVVFEFKVQEKVRYVCCFLCGPGFLS